MVISSKSGKPARPLMAKHKKNTSSENLLAAVAEMDRAYKERSQAYERFVQSIQGQEPRARADAWMLYTAQNIDTYGDQESLVYLRSRGHDCVEEINHLEDSWKDATEAKIEQCTRGHIISSYPSGRSRRFGAIPRAQAKEVKTMSSYVLRNFWGGHDSQEHFIDATMLRTVEWCEIGGFDEWWERLARDYRESILQGGFDSSLGSFWLFAMCRSDYAIQLMGDAMRRALEASELPVDSNPPWRIFRQILAKARKAHCMVDHLSLAATLIFANARLRPKELDNPLKQQAALELLKSQDRHGAWTHWADDEKESIEATAMCIHGLVHQKPHGWERAISKATKWLWTQQRPSGCWTDLFCPDPVYLSVLVLDALDLAAGRSQLTFCRSSVTPKPAKTNRRFRLALSFPGNLRPVVERVAHILAHRLGRKRVFYDKFFEAELARPNLDTYLQSIYHDQAEVVAVFLCAQYAKREWCGLEWRAVRDLIKSRRDADIMLLRTDSADIPGIFSIDGYIDVRSCAPDRIAQLIIERLASS